MSLTANADVVVCGVGGQTGDAVLSALAERRVPCRALVHREDGRDKALARGAVDVAVIDYDEPGDLAEAFCGAGSVFFVAPVFQDAEPYWVRNAVGAAQRAGVERFVYHSVLHPYAPNMPHHVRKALSEVIVRASSLAWTVLQPAMYAQTVLRVRARSAPGTVQVPYNPDRVFSVIDLVDLADCTATVLMDENHVHASYELTGIEPLSIRQMAAAMDAATGESRVVEQVELTPALLPDSWSLRQRTEYALMCAEYDAHGLVGAGTTTTHLLGRAPTLFAAVAARELDTSPTT